MDVYDARWLIVCSPLIAILFTFSYIWFMDKCAYWLSWFAVVVIELTLLGISIGSYFYRVDYIKDMSDQ